MISFLSRIYGHGCAIQDLSWAVSYLLWQEGRQMKPFIIRPIPSPLMKPLLVFVNPKSGGNQVFMTQPADMATNGQPVAKLPKGVQQTMWISELLNENESEHRLVSQSCTYRVHDLARKYWQVNQPLLVSQWAFKAKIKKQLKMNTNFKISECYPRFGVCLPVRFEELFPVTQPDTTFM